MKNDPASLTIMIVLGAFVIDRLVTACVFLLAYIPAWSKEFPDPAILPDPLVRRTAIRRQKLVYFALAGILAAIFLFAYPKVGVLGALGFQRKTEDTAQAQPSPATPPSSNVAAAPVSTEPTRSFGDFILTWLILIGGAENIAKLLKSYGDGGAVKTEPHPIEVSGRLTLEDHSHGGK